MNEDEPLGIVHDPPPHRDPWPEEEEPIVRHFETDSPRERKAALALERCTRQALAAWDRK